MTRKLSAIFLISLLIVAFLAGSSFAADKRAEREYLRHLNVKPIDKVPPAALVGGESVFGATVTKDVGQSLGFDQIPSASPGLQIGTTTYDYQHNGRMGRLVDWRSTQMVHFTWMKQVNTTLGGDRGGGYEVWDGTQSPGTFIHAGASSGGGCDVHPRLGSGNNYSGYYCLDVAEDGRALIGNHHDQGEVPPFQATVWFDFDKASCFFGAYRYRVPDSLAEYVFDAEGDYEYIWPYIEFQIYNNDTITHVFAQQSKGTAGAVQNIMYFRRVGGYEAGEWDYPPLFIGGVQDIAQTVTASRTTGKVGLVWFGGYPVVPGDTLWRDQGQRANDVFCKISNDAGATWGNTINISKFDSTTTGWLAHTDVSALMGTDNYLHVIWNAREAANGLFQHFFGCRLFHWTEQYPNLISTVKDANWDLPEDGCTGGAWNEMSIVKMQLSECDGKFYAMFVQFNDIRNGIDDDCHVSNWTANNSSGTANGELYISVSDNSGLNWDIARNLTNTYTPMCDTIGSAPRCESDMWPSISRFGMTTTGDFTGVTIVDPSGSYSGNKYMDVFYVNDKYPGGAVQDAGVWTVNPMRWFRVPCINPVPNPVLALSPSDIDDPTFTLPGVQKDTIVKVENVGNATMNISSVTTVRLTGTNFDWLGVTNIPTTVSHLLPNNFHNMTVQLNKGGAINTGPHAYDGLIIFAGNFFGSPDTMRIHLIVASELSRPKWAEIRTANKRVYFNNAGNMGRGGEDGWCLNFFNDCDTSNNITGANANAKIYLYDASPYIIRLKGADTVLNSYMWDADWLGGNGWRPVETVIVVDSTTYPDYSWGYTGTYYSKDSAIGAQSQYWASKHPDSASFIIQAVRYFNRTGATITGVMVGEMMDWDIPSDTAVDNSSGFDFSRQLMYNFGEEAHDDTAQALLTNNCVNQDMRMGGFSYVDGYKVPYTGVADDFDNVRGIFTGHNPYWQDGSGSFKPGLLYNKLLTFSGYENWTPNLPDPESVYVDQNMVALYTPQRDLGANDTLVFVKILATEYNGGLAGLQATIDKAKAWIAARPGIFNFSGHGIAFPAPKYINWPPVLPPIGNKSGTTSSALTFTIGPATDVENDVLTYSAANLPAGATFTPGTRTFDWPTPVVGTYNVTFYVTDGMGWDEETIQITISGNCCNLAGDANNNGTVNILDATFIIAYRFKGGPAPGCLQEADANGNGTINILDATYVISYLFKSGPAPICGP